MDCPPRKKQRQELTRAILRVDPQHPHVDIIHRAIEPMWAHGTWIARERLWERLSVYCQREGLSLTALNAIVFLESLQLAVTTRLTYARSLQTMFGFMDLHHIPLKLFCKALQAQGGLEPQRQMEPITPLLLRKLCQRLTFTQATACLLCWKAASRWTEVAELRREQFLSVKPTEIVIYWGRGTKTTRLNPYRPYMHAVITGPGTAELADYVSRLRQGDKVCRTTVREMDFEIRRILGSGFGTHSLKRGAITFLFREVVEGRLLLSEIQHLSKHLNLESLLRYNANQVITARALGTQRVSNLLPGL